MFSPMISNALEWVPTRPERPKGTKDKVKRPIIKLIVITKTFTIIIISPWYRSITLTLAVHAYRQIRDCGRELPTNQPPFFKILHHDHHCDEDSDDNIHISQYLPSTNHPFFKILHHHHHCDEKNKDAVMGMTVMSMRMVRMKLMTILI